MDRPAADRYPRTPDGRYFVVRGRLWRLADPAIAPAERTALVGELMAARRALRGHAAAPPTASGDARRRVDRAKRALGERGPVWWADGSPDYNRRMVVDTPYAEWFAQLAPAAPDGPPPPDTGPS